MVLKQIRIGGNPDILQYDDGDYSHAIDADGMPIKIGTSVDPDDAVRQDELPTGANIISSDAVIADNAIVRGDGGARKIQDSLVTIDDAGSISIPAGQTVDGLDPTYATTAAVAIDDNAVVRGDGGTRGLQKSGVIIDDSDNVNIPTGQGLQVNSVQVVTDQQAAESDAAAVSAITLGAGSDTVDRTTFNTDLGTLVTEINAIRTTLNNLLAKLRAHGLIDT